MIAIKLGYRCVVGIHDDFFVALKLACRAKVCFIFVSMVSPQAYEYSDCGRSEVYIVLV